MSTARLTIAGLVSAAILSACAVSPPPPREGLAPPDPEAESLRGPAPAGGIGSRPEDPDAGNAELAKQLANPIADLLSVPVQLDFDDDYGPANGHRTTISVEPVIPFSLNEDLRVVSRTFIPFIEQNDIAGNSGNQSGVGDILQSFFISPVEESESDWSWGVGPAFLLPTANDDLLGGEKFALGPTAALVNQDGPWTYGAIARHLISIGGTNSRPDIRASYVEPFVAYTTESAWTFTLNAESTYDWRAEDWSIPINGIVSKLIRLGNQPMSFSLGLRYWAETPDGGPEDLGLRFAFTLPFPK